MVLEKLVVDANAFIKGYSLETLSSKVYTIPEVTREIRDGATRRKLEFTPYELIFQEPSPEAIKRVTDFSKKTGDYASLSAVDIKLIALGIQIHEQYEPITFKEAKVRTVLGSGGNNNKSRNEDGSVVASNNHLPQGFYMPKVDMKKYNDHFKSHSYMEGYEFSHADTKLFKKFDGITIGNEFPFLKRWYSHIEALSFKLSDSISSSEEAEIEEEVVGDGDEEASSSSGVDEEMSSEEEDDENDEDSDGGGWITPQNYKPKVIINEESKVGILTTDFAMQNVILHSNLHLVSPSGQKITTLRSYILRCYTCFSTTTNFEKQFCPRCGNKTLRKVSVSIDENGEMKLHFSRRFVITSRGKKYSLPTPQGGKHAVNPILFEDQSVPQERRTKKSIARDTGPFSMNDVNSRSFFVKHNSSYYWDMRNPNEVKGKGRKRKNK